MTARHLTTFTIILTLSQTLFACTGANTPGIGNRGGGWAGGIGAVLRHRASSGTLALATVSEDGGAARAGLHVGDEIVTIDGAEVRGMSASALTTRLQGQVGTVVVLGIRRDGGSQDVRVERGPYRRPERTSGSGGR